MSRLTTALTQVTRYAKATGRGLYALGCALRDPDDPRPGWRPGGPAVVENVKVDLRAFPVPTGRGRHTTDAAPTPGVFGGFGANAVIQPLHWEQDVAIRGTDSYAPEVPPGDADHLAMPFWTVHPRTPGVGG